MVMGFLNKDPIPTIEVKVVQNVELKKGVRKKNSPKMIPTIFWSGLKKNIFFEPLTFFEKIWIFSKENNGEILKIFRKKKNENFFFDIFSSKKLIFGKELQKCSNPLKTVQLQRLFTRFRKSDSDPYDNLNLGNELDL